MKIVSCSPIFFHNVVVKCLHCILDLSYINLCRLVSPCRLRVAIQAIIDMVIIWQYCVYGFFPEMFLKPASALYEIKNPFVLGVCVCVCRQEGETFTKTSCYHYFHCHCLGRYVSHSESELRQREKELREDKTRDRAAYQVRYQPDAEEIFSSSATD